MIMFFTRKNVLTDDDWGGVSMVMETVTKHLCILHHTPEELVASPEIDYSKIKLFYK